MSFGQLLGQKTRAAQVGWVEETLRKFMAKCEEAAANQQCHAVMDEAWSSDKSSIESVEFLEQRLAELGFEAQGAQLLRCRTYEADTLRIHARWEVGPEVPKKTGNTPQGTKGNCPICHENRPMVALIPCGHTVCQQCQRSQQLRQCPMCRKNLTGATEALFMG
eukprot:Skav234874  [mRNA]  locus=scaffold840:356594:357085:- [translate_table: standard]